MLIDFFRITPKNRKIRLSKKRGVLFSNPGTLKKVLFYTGTGLFMFSIFYAFYLYIPLFNSYYLYLLSDKTNKNNDQQIYLPQPTLPTSQIKNQDYSISIPKILAQSKIVENVSPYDKNEYLEVLKNDVVAQVENTAKPGSGSGSMTYIFAHSTNQGISMVRNNAVFYLLGELKNDDIIYITRHGINYTYKVYKQLIVNANKVEYLKYSEPDKEILILQTCWPIGTDWKRLLVLAELIEK